jgi:hypothetical protein
VEGYLLCSICINTYITQILFIHLFNIFIKLEKPTIRRAFLFDGIVPS